MGRPLLLSVDTCGRRLLSSHASQTPSSLVRVCVSRRSFFRYESNLAPLRQLTSRRNLASLAAQDVTLLPGSGTFLDHLERNYRDDPLPQPPRNNGTGGDQHARHARHNSTEQLLGLAPSFHRLVDAVQLGDTRRALIYLRQIVQLSPHDLQAGIVALPRTFFTEVFKLLDPTELAHTADASAGVHIPRRMQTRLNLMGTVDDWGVRKLYPRLLDRLLTLAEAIRAGGYKLNNDEIHCLLRCAGAAGEPDTASQIWHSMVSAQTTDSRNSITYTEFIRAKFLTEDLYNSWNKQNRVVIPRNLHRSRLLLSKRRVVWLDRLRYPLSINKGLVGTNKTTAHVEDQMRAMRKVGPVRRLFAEVQVKGIPMTSCLTAAFIIAFGRAGSLRFIEHELLFKLYGLDIPQLVVSGTRKTAKLKSTPLHANSEIPRLAVDGYRLMDAVVEAFGSNGEITIAFQLLERISEVYTIGIPRKTWTDLLEWTHIMESRPISNMWAGAGLQSKIPTSLAVEFIYDQMRAQDPPIKMDFKLYGIMIRANLGKGRRRKALVFMREAAAQYRAAREIYDQNGFDYIQSLRDGALSNSTISRYEKSRFLLQASWYSLQMWCDAFLTDFRPLARVDNKEACSDIPAFIEEFREFCPNPARYRTPTGFVILADPASEMAKNVLVGHRTLDISYRGVDKDVASITPIVRRKVLVPSRHSLEGQWSSQLKAGRLLRNTRPSFRVTGVFADRQRWRDRRRNILVRDNRED
ncbi:Mitochondrial ATPase expression [Microdochium nivale]|nr:Mitochondrial ATPase expression [Microdochium nivale]